VGETLESVLRQRGAELRIVVSVDGGDETSVEACRPFLADPRVHLLVQRRRLGWVGNSSAALAAAAAEGVDYACLQPHDDVLEEDYMAALLAAAETNPGAAVVYSDIQCFGTRDRLYQQQTVSGSPVERQMCLLRDHFAAVAFRGLTRVAALRSILPMAGNPCENFAADTVWMARQALVGDLVRVPHALYRKRYHANNTHMQWFAWPRERKVTAWIRHCLDMLAVALRASDIPPERRMLHREARMRLLQRATATMPYYRDIVGMNPLARARMRWRFDAAAGLRADVGPPETAGRFRVGSRAVGALKHIVAGRTLQDLIAE
jgi:glycosyltransferase involved in cell wall biosynthesis